MPALAMAPASKMSEPVMLTLRLDSILPAALSHTPPTPSLLESAVIVTLAGMLRLSRFERTSASMMTSRVALMLMGESSRMKSEPASTMKSSAPPVSVMSPAPRRMFAPPPIAMPLWVVLPPLPPRLSTSSRTRKVPSALIAILPPSIAPAVPLVTPDWPWMISSFSFTPTPRPVWSKKMSRPSVFSRLMLMVPALSLSMSIPATPGPAPLAVTLTLKVLIDVSSASPAPTPVAAVIVARLPVRLTAAALASVTAPMLFDSPPPTPAKSAVMVTSPTVPSASAFAFTAASATSPGARSVRLPSCDDTVVPLAMLTEPAALPFAWVPLLKLVPPDTVTVPVPAALTVAVPVRLTVSPATSVMAPLPPVAVTFAPIVRSSVAAVPSAARVMAPPPVLLTAWLTASGLDARMRTASPTAPPVMLTPVVVPTVPIDRPPVVSLTLMSPVVVVAAKPLLAWVALISSSESSPAPLAIPATARSSICWALTLGVAPSPSLSTIAPEVVVRLAVPAVADTASSRVIVLLLVSVTLPVAEVRPVTPPKEPTDTAPLFWMNTFPVPDAASVVTVVLTSIAPVLDSDRESKSRLLPPAPGVPSLIPPLPEVRDRSVAPALAPAMLMPPVPPFTAAKSKVGVSACSVMLPVCVARPMLKLPAVIPAKPPRS